MLWNRIVRYKQKGVRWGRDPRYRRLPACETKIDQTYITKAASKYSELEHWGRLPLEDLEVQIACPGFQILDLNILVP